MAKYRQKQAEIEAMQWTGKNTDEVLKWVFSMDAHAEPYSSGTRLMCHTLNGVALAQPSDFIVHANVAGINEVYPCDANLFHVKYEAIDDRP